MFIARPMAVYCALIASMWILVTVLLWGSDVSSSIGIILLGVWMGLCIYLMRLWRWRAHARFMVSEFGIQRGLTLIEWADVVDVRWYGKNIRVLELIVKGRLSPGVSALNGVQQFWSFSHMLARQYRAKVVRLPMRHFLISSAERLACLEFVYTCVAKQLVSLEYHEIVVKEQGLQARVALEKMRLAERLRAGACHNNIIDAVEAEARLLESEARRIHARVEQAGLQAAYHHGRWLRFVLLLMAVLFFIAFCSSVNQ